MKQPFQTLLNQVGLTALVTASLLSGTVQAADNNDHLKSTVDQQAKLLMNEHNISGMAFGIIVDGKSHLYHYGLADKKAKIPVSENTIFELGSISKTFAATLASYSELNGTLALEDTADKYIPYLKNSAIGNTKLINLATYSAGGLPLQVPDDVKNNEELLRYYKSWQPVFPINSKRLYSNASIGLFGYISALSMDADYTQLMEEKILPSLNMPNTFINVPSDKMADYAFGYNAAGDAIRVNPGMLDAEAYGIKSTIKDMTHFMAANMGLVPLDKDIQQALNNNRKGYYQASTFTQGLGWEMYPYPTQLDTLLEGNSMDVVLKPQTITIDNHPTAVLNNVWVNKTGATNGFGGYIAYIPAKKSGIVILANKNYPNADRVKAAYTILESAMTR
ncbi:beta-lactamase [Psychrobacter sp. N25K4-3-2]|jgi:beta-lactamase class C|uniref:class C beta-lactamase n=1 Tax=unclassified Psychrobacter TaxID=196806 RepID=UPI000287E779|nr:MULTISPECIES: class C beta-lactamase [unclassified Psychrobacter]MBF4488800.1 beta-lactamase [Psychrobacter sp. N25K4-3-2]